MNCWKCGKELEEGVECDACNIVQLASTTPIYEYEIDWSKVKTLEDVVKIFSTIQIFVSTASSKFEELKPWLKPTPRPAK